MDKYIHKLTHFVLTQNSRRNCSIDLITRNVKNSDFCPFCTTNHYETLENPSLKLETEFASQSMTYPPGRVISHSLHMRFSKLLHFLAENLQHTQWRMNKLRLSAVNFIKKSLTKSYNNGTVYNRVGFKGVCTTTFRQNTELFYKVLPEQLNLEGQWEVAISEISHPSMYQKVTEGRFMFSWQETSKLVTLLLSGTWSLLCHYGYCWSHEHSHSRKTQSQRKLYHS